MRGLDLGKLFVVGVASFTAIAVQPLWADATPNVDHTLATTHAPHAPVPFDRAEVNEAPYIRGDKEALRSIKHAHEVEARQSFPRNPFLHTLTYRARHYDPQLPEIKPKQLLSKLPKPDWRLPNPFSVFQRGGDAAEAPVMMAQTERAEIASAAKPSLIERWASPPTAPGSGAVPSPPTASEGLLTHLSSSWTVVPQDRNLALGQLDKFIATYNKNLSPEARQQLAITILDLSQQQQVDYRLTASMVAVESSFRPNAVSRTGAMGLGQLKDFTARWLKVTNPFDPVDNIRGMTSYLYYLVNLFPQDISQAIGSYYIGQGAMQRGGMTDDALRYVQKVEKAYSLLLTS